MAGLVKQKKYDWKDSNLAMFGSDTERQVKKESAQQEPAWKGAGDKVGVQVWRIVKFKVTHWPKEDYGKFYDGDSYIILNTYKEEGTDELLYDVHFWIGQYSTQDEYGTAAYKTVELDTLLDDKPIQHREVQQYESELFRTYFKSITYLKGGADSGFRHVEAKTYTPRLFHFHGDKRGMEVKEVARIRNKLDETDVYILDLGLKLYQWHGKDCNKDEKMKASDYVRQLANETGRSGKCKVEVLDQFNTEDDHEFYRSLDQTEEDDDTTQLIKTSGENTLHRVSDATGELKMTLEKQGKIDMADFDTKDAFIFDTHKHIFVWIGKGTTRAERKNAMTYAHKYLQKSDHPYASVSCLMEGKRNTPFETALAA